VRQTPLLILAYNRADKVRGLIDRLRELAPPIVMVVVDGPKPGNARDEANVIAVRDAVSTIDWTTNVSTRFRPVNLGLRASVVDAVNWATSEYGQVIVIEEDVLPGPAFLPYMTAMLERFRDDERIMHVSGYNVVPPDVLRAGPTASRLTEYPESIAWGTWDRAWSHFDDGLTWGRTARLAQLRTTTGSRGGALRWRQNFNDAATGRISTWAYRWIASMWSSGGVSLSPNLNLVEYVGHDEGTNTLTRASWIDLPVYTGPADELLNPTPEADPVADAWVNRVVFRGTAAGVIRGVAVSLVLGVRKRRRAARGAGLSSR
jgi:hypothetical protein